MITTYWRRPGEALRRGVMRLPVCDEWLWTEWDAQGQELAAGSCDAADLSEVVQDAAQRNHTRYVGWPFPREP